MTFDDRAAAAARTATHALRELARSDRDPAGQRRRDAELLGELADLVSAVAGAVDVASGRPDPDVRRPAEELAAAVRRRRDALVAREAPTGPVPPGPVPPAVAPAAGAGDRPHRHDDRGPGGPKHRAQRHLRPVR